jgi:terminal uridylyltransferase
VTGAKVPIVRFVYYEKLPNFEYEIEVDISVYNTLALENTLLLKTYAAIDDRVQVPILPKFTKMCNYKYW